MEEKYGIHFREELLTAPGFGPMTREIMDTVQSVLDMNDPVGLASGYYTDRPPRPSAPSTARIRTDCPLWP